MTVDHDLPFDDDNPPIAVIAYAGRFPGCRSPEELWDNLHAGNELYQEATDEQLLAGGIPPEQLDADNLVRRRPVLADVDQFDARFFGYTPKEASITDPQQRLFLEVCWELFERAGHDPGRVGEGVGVFAGGGPETYKDQIINRAARSGAITLASVVGNDRGFLAPRVAYKLDLRGPAITVLAGCATSLVAVHLAVQSLLDGETEMAVAGGVTIFFPQHTGYLYDPGGPGSSDGRCRPFSSRAEGATPGEAAAAVLLKRLPDAIEDGDQVHALILGSAVNNDGSGKMVFTAPTVEGEQAAIEEALGVAGVDPATISHIESHGTATALGDAVEIEAINRALAGSPVGGCRIGAIKATVGHTDTAAGVAGLIKTVLSLRNEEIPAIPNFPGVNPDLPLDDSPCVIASTASAWPREPGRPRRAGVSSFSMGGTNAHVIVEEPPLPSPTPGARTDGRSDADEVLVLSARTPTALDRLTENLADHLATTETDLAAAAFTLRNGRRPLEVRRSVVVPAGDDPVAALWASKGSPPTSATPGVPVVFAFPGQASQFAGMGAELYRRAPAYAEVIDYCATELAPLLGRDIRPLLHPSADDLESAATALADTAITQPALLAVEVATATLLRSWGLTPVAVTGHSIGEFSAAVVAGVMTLDDALRAVVERGRLMAVTAEGAMVAIGGGGDVAERFAGNGLEVAAINSPSQTVLTGPEEQVDAVIARCETEGVKATKLRSSYAFHSSAVESLVEPMTAAMADLDLRPPDIAMTWGPDGAWLTADQAASAADWGGQLRRAVDFAGAVSSVCDRFPNARWIEAGPGTTLGSFARAGGVDTDVLPTVGRGPRTRPADIAGRLWTAGLDLDWGAVGPETARRIELPTYPFERRSHWVDAPAPSRAPAAANGTASPVDPGDGRTDHDGLGPVTLDDDPFDHGRLDDDLPDDGDVAEVMVAIWRQEFGIPELTTSSDFFHEGGDSLLAATIAGRVRDRFGIEFDVSDVMDTPSTPRSSADVVDRRLDEYLDGLSDEEVAALLAADEDGGADENGDGGSQPFAPDTTTSGEVPS